MEKSVPLTNLQMELLKIFAMNVDEEDLFKIKYIIANYLAEKAHHSAYNGSKPMGYSQEDLDKWLHEEKR
jgi:hypothetical protein